MPQLSKMSKNNTTTTIDGHGRIDSVTLHHTRILEIDWGKGEITVNTGGYNTVTTQTRLNQAFNQLGLPFCCGRTNYDKWNQSWNALEVLNRETKETALCESRNGYTVTLRF